MTVHCPSCHAVIEDQAGSGSVTCSVCGSCIRFSSTSTVAHRPDMGLGSLGKFELLEEVGAGSFGTVFKARDKELGRTVAIKTPRAGSLGSSGDSARFLREARSVAQLRHPSIVPVYEIGQDNGTPFLVSEFVHGVTLDDLLTSERMPPRQAAALAADIADALQYAHSQGVVHRDVKPSNIMVTAVGDQPPGIGEKQPMPDSRQPIAVRIMDFGLAKREAGEVTMTVEGQVLGTPAYMSPEQARGDSHAVDGRSDIYSVGVILYQLLTGELPFKGNARMLLHHVLHDEPKPPRARDPKVPRDLETICLTAMAKDPARRYAAAGDLAADLRSYLKDEPIRARPATLMEKAWRRVRRNPVVAALTAAVLLLFVVLSGLVAVTFMYLLGREQATFPSPAPTVQGGEPDAFADELPQVIAELDRTDPHWRIEDIEANRRTIPDAENGALQVVAFRKEAGRLKGDQWSEGAWQSPAIRERERDLLNRGPREPLTEADAQLLRTELPRVAPLLDLGRGMTRFRDGRFPTNYKRDAISTMLGDHQAGFHLSMLLQFDALLQLHENRPAEALRDAQALLHVGCAFGDDPIAIAQIMRSAVFRRGLQSLERILATHACSDADLAEVQKLLEEEAALPMFLIMCRGERGFNHHLLGALSAGDLPKQEILEHIGITSRDQLPSLVELRRLHAWLLRHQSKVLELARQPSEQWLPSLTTLDAEIQQAPLAGTPLVRTILLEFMTEADVPRRSLTYRLANSALLYLAELRTGYTALAVERYRLAHGDWPPNLAALTPAYLKEVPRDPYDGQPLRYRRTLDGVVIHAVGSDGTDNQGNLWRSGNVGPNQDIGFQLWDRR